MIWRILGVVWRVVAKGADLALSAGIAADRGIDAGKALMRDSPLLKRFKPARRAPEDEPAPATLRSKDPWQ